MNDKAITPVSKNMPVKQAGIQAFSQFLEQRKGTINAVAASFMNPNRLMKVTIGCVMQTPALQNCSLDSIFRSMMQSAELGLEPGSALGESYLVPFGNTSQLIVGYRGLISLAYRSGFVESIQANEVYEGDVFEFEKGLNPKLKHIPGEETDPNKITHAYCVVRLKNGAVQYDVMTKNQIERIRKRSRAGGSGPWTTDYAAMCCKTVTRKTLKYVPMSVEMSKAFALDTAADTGERVDVAEFDFIETEYEVTEEPERTTGTDAVKAKLGMKKNQQSEPLNLTPEQAQAEADEYLSQQESTN